MMNFSAWRLDHWISSVMELAPHAPVLLVGTYQDTISNNRLGQIQGFITTRYKSKFPFIVGFLSVSYKTSKNIKKLKQLITFCASRSLILFHKHLSDNATYEQYRKLENHLLTLSSQSDYISLSEFIQHAEKFNLCG
jgi:hypothetical protein